MGKVQRNLLIYLPLIGLIITLGLPARLVPQYLPSWYVTYAGDFLWAMLVFFLYALLFRFPTKVCFCVALITAYLIEFSQLFHPAWLDALRSIRLFGFILGFGFLWSDLIAYTLGISLAAGIDRLLLSPKKTQLSSSKNHPFIGGDTCQNDD
jgi:CDP-diglyceride synthetase